MVLYWCNKKFYHYKGIMLYVHSIQIFTSLYITSLDILHNFSKEEFDFTLRTACLLFSQLSTPFPVGPVWYGTASLGKTTRCLNKHMVGRSESSPCSKESWNLGWLLKQAKFWLHLLENFTCQGVEVLAWVRIKFQRIFRPRIKMSPSCVWEIPSTCWWKRASSHYWNWKRQVCPFSTSTRPELSQSVFKLKSAIRGRKYQLAGRGPLAWFWWGSRVGWQCWGSNGIQTEPTPFVLGCGLGHGYSPPRFLWFLVI